MEASELRRLNYYARSVKWLEVRSQSQAEEGYLLDIAFSLQGRPMLPNLKTLVIHTPVQQCSMVIFLKAFMSRTIKVLTIWVDPGDNDSTSQTLSILQRATSTCPYLITLDVFAYNGLGTTRLEKHDARSISRAVSKCTFKNFSMDFDMFSEEFMNFICSKRGPRTIGLLWDYDDDGSSTEVRVPLPRTFSETPGPFQLLSELTFRIGFESITNVFRGVGCFPSLSNLKLELVLHWQTERQDLEQSLVHICSSCCSLKTFVLIRYDSTPMPHQVDKSYTANPPLHLVGGLQALKPILRLTFLRAFSFHHYWPLHVTDAQLTDFLRDCPPLDMLELNPHPIKDDAGVDTRLTMLVLPEIARLQPQLKRLSLFINPLIQPTISPLGKLPNYKRFKSLAWISFGSSPIPEDWEAILFLLGQLLPPQCSISTRITMDAFRRLPKDKGGISHRRNDWKKLQDSLSLILRFRSFVE